MELPHRIEREKKLCTPIASALPAEERYCIASWCPILLRQ